MKIFYLNNPASGHKNGVKFFPLVLKALKERNIEFVSSQTEYAGQGIEIVRDLNFENYDALVVSGGDGTIFEALNGYFANPSKKRIPIGMVP